MDHLLPPALALILGALLLVAGRRLFWMLIGVAGFLAGMWLADLIFQPQSEAVRWGIGILAGLIGIGLAKLFQKMAVGIAGFFLGGLAAVEVLNLDISAGEPKALILFVIAGVLAAILAGWLFEVALIVFSSYLGAMLVIDAVGLPETVIMLGVLFAAGVLVQASLGARRAATAT